LIESFFKNEILWKRIFWGLRTKNSHTYNILGKYKNIKNYIQKKKKKSNLQFKVERRWR